MLAYLLSLRFRILGRMLRELGVVRLTVLSVSVTAGLWYLSMFVTTTLQAVLLAGFTISALGSVHISRRDGRFLRTIGARAWTLYALEYTAYASPVAAVLMVIGEAATALGLVAGCFTLPAFGVDASHRKRRRRRNLLTSRNFEWIAGLRRTWLFAALVYMLGAGFARSPVAVPLSLVILATLATTYFHVGEGRMMMEVYGLSPRAFLYDKVTSSLVVYWLCCAPLTLVYVVLHPHYWMLLAAVAVGCSVLMGTAVLAKYAFFAEGERFSNPHALVITVSLSSMVLFVLALVAVGLVFWLYFRAVANLNVHLKPAHT